MDRSEALVHNEACFDHAVEKGAGSTIPCLDLDRDMVRRFARGELDPVPRSLRARGDIPGVDLTQVDGKDVLCLGMGGGQQSAVYSLLGGRVTVLELSQRQLEGDRAAAAHYGYEITTIHGDMQDPSCLADGSFDIVHTHAGYIPDVRQLFRECARLMRPGGVLSIGLLQPVQQARYLSNLVTNDPYDPGEGDSIEYIHYMDDIFNGLLDAGLCLTRVFDEGRAPEFDGPAGSLDPGYVDDGGYFVVAATKPQRQ